MTDKLSSYSPMSLIHEGHATILLKEIVCGDL